MNEWSKMDLDEKCGNGTNANGKGMKRWKKWKYVRIKIIGKRLK